ncbi:MAG: response regulator [Bacteroidetes bacterium]|nr:response regulator [Bacteroidota bacterium]
MFSKNTQPASSSDSKEQITKLLRSADEFFRYRNFDAAIAEIEKALQLDPKNSLARSFIERIKLTQKQTQLKDVVSHSSGELSAEEKLKMLNDRFAAIEQHLAQKDYKRAMDKVAEVFGIDPTNFYAKAYSDRIDELMRIEREEKAKQISQVKHDFDDKASMPKGSCSMYHELLKEAWFDGKITPEEEAELKRVREIFGISIKEHYEIEHNVKIEAYVEALQLAWKDGVVTENERKVLELMRQRYMISPEEHLSAEDKIKEARRTSSSRGVILVVDPDPESLANISKALKKRNFDVDTTHRVEDALEVIVSKTPHLIISEIYFSLSSIDGFSFFKKLRELENFKNIPFMFLTSMKDSKIARAGLRLGMDNFFQKPVDIKLLVATVEGKFLSNN